MSTFLRYCSGILLSCVVLGWCIPRTERDRIHQPPRLLPSDVRLAAPLSEDTTSGQNESAGSVAGSTTTGAHPEFVSDPNVQLVALEQSASVEIKAVKIEFTPSRTKDPVSREVPKNGMLWINPSGSITLTAELEGSGKKEVTLRADDRVKLFRTTDATNVKFTLPTLSEGEHEVSLLLKPSDKSNDASDSFFFTLKVRRRPVIVQAVDASSLAYGVTPYTIRVTFNTDELDHDTVTASNFTLYFEPPPESDQEKESAICESVHVVGASVELKFNKALPPGVQILEIKGVQDVYGNALATNAESQSQEEKVYRWSLFKPAQTGVPSVRPGIPGATGPYVRYPEFTAPRRVPSGFNPNDKVETRVARLYYYRDAHRVAQIINRKVHSYNRAGVDMARQLADRARIRAEQVTMARRAAERDAIERARKTRLAEAQLASAQQALDRTVQMLIDARKKAEDSDDKTVNRLEAAVERFRTQVREAEDTVAVLRDEEAVANERVRELEQQENLAREEQFQREVAAAHADPDTYAPGIPKSDDPVEQVSISVIGEGLIHLRGPLKGINIIRTMIDQIDAPVGQVRIGVHTIQINGERADRMEVIAKRIQRYIDQARFLSMQSAELLRRAIVEVATEVAMESGQYSGDIQCVLVHRELEFRNGRVSN